MTRPAADMNESPVEVYVPESTSPRETPDKEVDNLTRTSILFSVIESEQYNVQSKCSLTPGPIHSNKSPNVSLDRRTPGAVDKTKAFVVSDGVSFSGSESRQVSGPFGFEPPMIKESLKESLGLHYETSPEGDAESKYPSDNKPQCEIVQHPHSFLGISKSGSEARKDVLDNSLTPSVNRNKNNVIQTPEVSTHYRETMTGTEICENDEDGSPTQFMITRNLQALMNSPLTICGDNLSKTTTHVQQSFHIKLEDECVAPERIHKLSVHAEEGAHFDISPGKNIHSAIFEPMGHKHENYAENSLAEGKSSKNDANHARSYQNKSDGIGLSYAGQSGGHNSEQLTNKWDDVQQGHMTGNQQTQNELMNPHYSVFQGNGINIDGSSYQNSVNQYARHHHPLINTSMHSYVAPPGYPMNSNNDSQVHRPRVRFDIQQEEMARMQVHGAASSQATNQYQPHANPSQLTIASGIVVDKSGNERTNPITRSVSPPLPSRQYSQQYKRSDQKYPFANTGSTRMQFLGSQHSGSSNFVPVSSSGDGHVLPRVAHNLTASYPLSSPKYTQEHARGFDAFGTSSLDFKASHGTYFSAVPSHAHSKNSAGSGVASVRKSKEDPTKTSRQEQVESPNSKAIYKAFSKQFCQKESVSVEAALRFAHEEAVKVPQKIKWRIYGDAADLLRRNNRYEDARYMYALSCEEFPHVQQTWIEWAKLEEECGKFEMSLKILRKGAKRSTTYNEVLLMKAIKQHEKLSRLDGARELLGKLHNEPIEKVWRSLLEGAMLEERSGNIAVARKLFCVLVHKVAWYGPIYYEAFRLEEKAELFDVAYFVIKKGLAELPRYGPLWFGLLRIMERADIIAELQTWQSGDGKPPVLARVRTECQNAVSRISRELVWKIHFEQAQIEERAAVVIAQSQSTAMERPFEECLDSLLGPARQCFIFSMLACPSNLRWKIFLAGARMELSTGKIDTVKSLLRQAHIEVPEKSRYHVFLECSRLEEYLGNVDTAREILAIARSNIKSEWKIFLESVLVEARAGDLTTAIFIADQALSMDSGSGRLWALLIQLVHRVEWKHSIFNRIESEENRRKKSKELRHISFPDNYIIPSKRNVFSRALQVVPKSGEVWCEGARVLLNPFCPSDFHPLHAMQYLSFAIMFTPQYGDSFLEYVRLEMLLQVVLPQILALLGVPFHTFFQLVDTYDNESDFVGILIDPPGPPGLSRNSEVSALVSANFYQSMFPADRFKRRYNMQLAVNGKLSLSGSSRCFERVDLRRLHRRYV